MIKILFYVFLCLLPNLMYAQWNQQGGTLLGDFPNDRFGHFVAISDDGSTVIVGAPFNDDMGTDAGQIKVYRYISGDWVQLGEPIYGEATGDEFGYHVSISADGETIAAGAPYNDGGGVSSGHARVFHYISGTWVQLGPAIEGEFSHDRSAQELHLSEDGLTLAIGAIYNDHLGTDVGHVRVFRYVLDTWMQLGSDIYGEAVNDRSGYEVCLSSDGQTVAIASVYNDGAGTNAGHVRVYRFLEGIWTQIGSDIDGENAGDWFGHALALSADGETVAVGARYSDGIDADAGNLSVFRFVEGAWTQIGSNIDGEFSDDQFGFSTELSADGQVVAVSAPFNDEIGSDAGHVRVFQFISDEWIQVGGTILGEAEGDRAGFSVGISGDGSKLIVGSPLNNDVGTDAGHVKIYTLCSAYTTIDVQTACDSLVWIDGITYTASTTEPTYTLTDMEGCDSVLNLELDIIDIDNGLTFIDPITLFANEEDAEYQWLNCEDDYSEIASADEQSYTAETNGVYAVRIMKDECIDTSDCISISAVGIHKQKNEDLSVFFDYENNCIRLKTLNSTGIIANIYSSSGQHMARFKIDQNTEYKRTFPSNSGIYFLQIMEDNKIKSFKFIVH